MFRKEQSTDLVNWKLLGSFENDADDANNGAVIRVWRLFKPAFVKGTLSRSTWEGTFPSLISQFVHSNVKRGIDRALSLSLSLSCFKVEV